MEFVSYFGCSSKLRIGLECEAFLFRDKRLSYAEILPIFLWFLETGSWTPHLEGKTLIGLKGRMGSFSLEPGGQFEYATPPVDSLEQLSQYLSWYHDQLHCVSQRLKFEAVFKGYDDLTYEVPWMPKQRAEIMRRYMPKVGTLGLEMMQRTCTVQLNLDYTSEEDMVSKARKATQLHPEVIEKFSTSPHQGIPCYRDHIWKNTDPARTGPLSFVGDKTMGFQRYVDYLLNIPMYCIERNSTYIDMTEKYLLETDYTWKDWVLLTNTVYPEVRLNPHLELRGADSGPFEHQMSLAKFWVENLY